MASPNPPTQLTFWRNISPGGAISDLAAVIRQAGPARWRIGAASIVCAMAIFSLLAREEQRIPPRLPTITYINAWRADRSDAEIRAGNRAWHDAQQKLDAEEAEREREVKELYKTIGRASGMDVEAIERKAAADQAADQRKLEARLGHPAPAPAAPPATTDAHR